MHHNFNFIKKKTISVLHRHKVWQQTFNSVKVSDSLDGIFTFSLSVIIIGFKTMWILPKALTLYHLLTVIHPINMHSLKIKKIHCWSSPSIERSTRLGENELMKGSFGYIRYGRWLWWAVSELVWMRSGHHSNFCFCENSPSDRGWTALCSVTAAASRTASSGSACLGHWRPCGWNPGKCPGTFHLL